MVVREDATQCIFGAGAASSPSAIDLAGAASVLIVGVDNIATSGLTVSSDGTTYAAPADADLVPGAGGNVLAYIGPARFMKITTKANHDVYVVGLHYRHCPTPESTP